MSFWKPGSTKSPGRAPSSVSPPSSSSKPQSSSSSSSKPSAGSRQSMSVVPSSSDVKPTLSKSVMSMRFMKRKEELAQQDCEHQAQLSEAVEAAAWSRSSMSTPNANGSGEATAMDVQEGENEESDMKKETSNSSCGRSDGEKIIGDASSSSSSSSSSSMDVCEQGGDLSVSTSKGGARLICSRDETVDISLMLPGRRSFGGFNKSVERNYQAAVDALRFDKVTSSSRTRGTEVSDEEMVARYESLIALPRGPNQSRRPDPPRPAVAISAGRASSGGSGSSSSSSLGFSEGGRKGGGEGVDRKQLGGGRGNYDVEYSGKKRGLENGSNQGSKNVSRGGAGGGRDRGRGRGGGRGDGGQYHHQKRPKSE